MLLDRHHLILYGVVAAGLLVGFYLYADWRAQVADARVQAASAVLAEVKQSNALLTQQIFQQAAAFAQEREQRDRQSAALLTEIQHRGRELTDQKKRDETLSLPEAGDRWTRLAGLGPGDLVATADGRLSASLDAARRTVIALEDLPVLRLDLGALRQQLENEKQNVAGLDQRVGDQQKLIEGKDAELKASGAVCDAKIGQEKAKARKSKSKWFMAGVVVGWVGRTLTGR